MSTVSVILPVKNGASTLTRAIASIQTQSLEDWELIAIENGSTDESLNILQSLASVDSRIQVFHQQKPGLVEALNLGIARARGEVIARMDADDVSHPERLHQQFSFLNENKDFGLVSTRVNYVGNASKQAGYANYVSWINGLTRWDDIRRNRFVESPFAHPSVMFRKALLDNQTGPYRQGNFPEDYELWLRWMHQGVRMAKLEQCLLDWHDPPRRLSRTDPRYSPSTFYRIKATYLAQWLKDEGIINRPIWIWGAGRITRKRAARLQEKGISFAGYIDIDPGKTNRSINGLPVVQPEDLDLGARPFVIPYVGSRGARQKIKMFLLDQGFQEEKDFILAA